MSSTTCASSSSPLLEVNQLSVQFHARRGVINAVTDLSFTVRPGETIAIVGESGSGKSVSCYSLLNLIPQPPGKIASGQALFKPPHNPSAAIDLLDCSPSQMRSIRGNNIAVIFQDPMTSLNPFITIGEQLIEPLLAHRELGRAAAKHRALQILDEVGIADAAQRFNSYPHEFSGGMRQRVMIAMALITEPELIIADEPTTALDVTVQAQILELIKELQQRHNIAMIFVSHDLAVVANIASNIIVMHNGKMVEQGDANTIFNHPKQDYTRSLLAAIPAGGKAATPPVSEQPLVDVRELSTHFDTRQASLLSGLFKARQMTPLKAVDKVNLTIHRGEILGLVGESGSGKSTLGRSILQLIRPSNGSVRFDNAELGTLTAAQLKQQRRRMQMIFQDPYASLNPRMTVFKTLAEPLLYHGLANAKTIDLQVAQLMDEVGLAAGHRHKYPHEFSGGQRQRIAIARALATQPDFIVADEPVSALDVTIQAQILELLMQLVKDRNLSLLFISHDLSVIRKLCDRVLVMRQGRIVERNNTESLFRQPQHEYTRALLSAMPVVAQAEPG